MQVLNIFHVLIAVSLVAFILIQKGQGATAGAAFGSGASGTVFGARGAGNFLTRTTWVLAALFCSISLVMAVMVSRTSTLPANDLGVVGSSQSQSEPADKSGVGDTDAGPGDATDTGLSVGADDAADSDMPLINSATDSVDESSLRSSDAVNYSPGDLPGLDSESIESAATEKAQDAASGSDGEDLDTDRSL